MIDSIDKAITFYIDLISIRNCIHKFFDCVISVEMETMVTIYRNYLSFFKIKLTTILNQNDKTY